jgi:uncharacterized SAM-binding protein YcdF (DUF218 family)
MFGQTALLTRLWSIGDVLIPPLERRFQRADLTDPSRFTGVIALGGGEERIREAGRLARRFPHLRVAITGAGEASLVRSLLGEGIDSDRIRIEDQARNTHQNALFTAKAVAPQAGERWLLVTSASHMPRAVGAFRRAGLRVEPWPVYDLANRKPMPAAVAWHEWLGLLGYWGLGWSSSIFPAKAD